MFFWVVFKKFPFYLDLCIWFIFCWGEPIMYNVENSQHICSLEHYYSVESFSNKSWFKGQLFKSLPCRGTSIAGGVLPYGIMADTGGIDCYSFPASLWTPILCYWVQCRNNIHTCHPMRWVKFRPWLGCVQCISTFLFSYEWQNLIWNESLWKVVENFVNTT